MDYVIIGLLVAAVAAVIGYLIRKRKRGGGCSGCSSCSSCSSYGVCCGKKEKK